MEDPNILYYFKLPILVIYYYECLKNVFINFPINKQFLEILFWRYKESESIFIKYLCKSKLVFL